MVHNFLVWLSGIRVKRIYRKAHNPIQSQNKIFKKLIRLGRFSMWGEVYDFKKIKDISDFQKRVPLSTYEDLYPWIEQMLDGKRSILWPGKVKLFAKSSGTTNARSKYIPVTKTFLKNCHFKGGKDMLALYLNKNSTSQFYKYHTLAIVGSLAPSPSDPTIICGDISAVITRNLPWWAQSRRIPHLNVALLPSWEEKAERIIDAAKHFNVSVLAGTPTWISLLLEGIKNRYKNKTIYERWPHLEVFFHGAVSFKPYKTLFDQLLPDNKVKFVELYNASEGFFAIQDREDSSDMLLMVDYDVFYEFIPLSEYGKENQSVLTLAEVTTDIQYVIVISSSAGLWRYVIGDTIRFTSLKPYKIVITGRTKYFINAFGEEVVAENAEVAIERACEKTGAIINNFTAGPIFMTEGSSGSHEWIVEFSKVPNSTELFELTLDQTLREVNSDYDAKRNADAILSKPKINYVPLGTFFEWMKRRNKLGGQNKVPILSNDRTYIDDIMSIVNTK